MSRAVDLAKKCGITVEAGGEFYCPRAQDLEAFYHAARAEMAREAASVCYNEHGTAGDAGAKIRAMADREGK